MYENNASMASGNFEAASFTEGLKSLNLSFIIEEYMCFNTSLVGSGRLKTENSATKRGSTLFLPPPGGPMAPTYVMSLKIFCVKSFSRS